MTSVWPCRSFVSLASLPTLCVLNWNAVSLSNSEPLYPVFSIYIIHRFMYLNFKWRASLVPAAAVIPAPLAYTIIVAVKRLVVGLNKHREIYFFMFYDMNFFYTLIHQ